MIKKNRAIFLIKLLNSPKRGQYVFICIGVSTSVALLQPLLTDHVYDDTRAIGLLESIKESSLYLSSAIATASATVLALMLTLLSITSQVDKSFERSTCKDIKLIGDLSTVTFISSVALLLLLSLPIGEFKVIDKQWGFTTSLLYSTAYSQV